MMNANEPRPIKTGNQHLPGVKVLHRVHAHVTDKDLETMTAPGTDPFLRLRLVIQEVDGRRGIGTGWRDTIATFRNDRWEVDPAETADLLNADRLAQTVGAVAKRIFTAIAAGKTERTPDDLKILV
jgi:hypothetical protein